MAFVRKMISCFFLILIATVATAFDYYDIDYYNQNVESSTTLMPKLTSPSLTTTGTKTKTVPPEQSSKITTKTPRKTTTTTTTIAPTTTIKANNTSTDFYPDRLNGLSTTSKNLAFSSSPNSEQTKNADVTSSTLSSSDPTEQTITDNKSSTGPQHVYASSDMTSTFLIVHTHLYKTLHPFVGPSVY